MKPIFRWPGSKKRFASKIAAHFPEGIKHYAEPFVATGAVMLELMAQRKIVPGATVQINDLAPVTCFWRAVLKNPSQLVELHEVYVIDGNTQLNFEVAKDTIADGTSCDVEMAAAFLHLNQTSFSGIFRRNRKGEFNVSRDAKKMLLPKTERIWELHEFLKPFDVLVGPCLDCSASAVYLDPPYQGKTFTAYGADPFGDEEHRALADHCFALVSEGSHVVVSNSDTPLVRELYPEPEFELHTFDRPNNVSSKASTRKETRGELIIVGRP